MKVTFKSVEEPQEGVAVVVIFENNTYSLEAEELDKKMGGLIQRALKATDFKGLFLLDGVKFQKIITNRRPIP